MGFTNFCYLEVHAKGTRDDLSSIFELWMGRIAEIFLPRLKFPSGSITLGFAWASELQFLSAISTDVSMAGEDAYSAHVCVCGP
jgi:hypothetical protein